MPLLKGQTRSELSKKIWRRRKREGGKAICAWDGKPIYTGGVLYKGRAYHKSHLGFAIRGFTPEQLAMNPIHRVKLEWLEANCPICGKRYEYLSNYRPATCGKFSCVQEAVKQGLMSVEYPLSGYPIYHSPQPPKNPRARTAWRYYGAIPMNPRPPAGWWARMYPSVRASYPGASVERAARITAGIWYSYSPAVRTRLLRKYD